MMAHMLAYRGMCSRPDLGAFAKKGWQHPPETDFRTRVSSQIRAMACFVGVCPTVQEPSLYLSLPAAQ